MEWLAGILGVVSIAVVLWDAFEIVLLPRRTAVRWRISRLVLTVVWGLWSTLGRRIQRRNQREDFLGLYALLALIGLLVVWASGLIVGFALLFRAGGSDLMTAGGPVGFRTNLYVSGTTFFTLGLGDVVPTTAMARFLAVTEAGTGFGFLALVLAYLPVLYQSFSRRETRITTLDEWGGSPPTAAVLLRRCFESPEPDAALRALLRDWEVAAAEILESHLSYPILAFFRSQHDNQSWLAALTAVLDTCALAIVGVEGIDPFQPRLTFAIGRHALVDVSQILRRRPDTTSGVAVRAEPVAELRAWLATAGVKLATGPDADRRLAELRALYEPYVEELSRQLVMPLPPWLPPERARYNWETTAWARTGRMDAH
ncbi:MAG: potassium channel family protein [Candidatus Eisenbacteria bacterium]